MFLALAASTVMASCGVTEALAPTKFTLTVTQSGDGGVTSSPGGISTNANGGSSSSEYNENTSVTLTATPAAGWEFSSWGGDCSTAATTCQVTMSSNRSASATFTPVPTQFTLSMTKTGSGTVESSPTGISIAVGGTSGSATFDDGTSVTLTATAAAGWQLASWGGDCAAATTTCQLTMSADMSASVTFTPVAANQFTLSVTKSGSGTVSSGPAGISIATGGTSGSAPFDDATVVTLTATPETGWRIAAWSGGSCTGNATTCVVTMDANQSVSVIFELIPPGTDLSTGVPVTGLAGSAGSSQTYKLAVPAGASSLRFEIEGGTGNADLRVRFGAEPNLTEFDCSWFGFGADNEESCNHGNPAQGDWFVQVSGFTAYSDVTLIGTYQVDPSGYSIQIEFDPSTAGWTAAEVAAVTQGIRKWESMFNMDLEGAWSTGGCGETVDAYVDDFLVYVTQGTIDGASGTLAQAGFCSRRQIDDAYFVGGQFYTGWGNTLPYYGIMTFDEVDVSSSLASGLLDDVAAHEMGHALGIGVLWSDPEFDLIQGPDAAPFHVGASAIAAFNTAGGVGSEIPIEPVVKGHWDENAFGDELMTPLLGPMDLNPLSPITLGAFEDMGYSVDYSMADLYTFSPGPALVAGATGRQGVYMVNDILRFEPTARVDPRALRRR